MHRVYQWIPWCIVVALVVAAGIWGIQLRREWDEWNALTKGGSAVAVSVHHPQTGAVFPANASAPIVVWDNQTPEVDRWIVGVKTSHARWLYHHVQPRWHVPEKDWKRLTATAPVESVEIFIAGYDRKHSGRLAAASRVVVSITQEKVEAPLFYREVVLPFIQAVKDPSRIRWRFGGIEGCEPPPIVLQKLPVCGNCHSFSRDGGLLAMDVDYANSKGSYIISRTGRDMKLATSDIITWDDYRKEDGQQTFGLLSQISPDGRYVLSTVKDRSVFVPRPDLAFSQLFFPLKGIIAVYDRERKEYFPLPGADDPAMVQSNPVWSPDGKWVLFARNRAYELKNVKAIGAVVLNPNECKEFLKDGKEFRYDLYRLPFNGGRGGTPEPLRGASGNGKSNFFPKISPDGRWIIFCQASNYMLLQPDSALFIIPAEGGEARRLGCNLGRMNSWHSWSPDGRWLAFSSKADSDYTQLYLTHINEKGEASPAIWLDRMVAEGRAANIPEFVPLASGAIAHIQEQFLDDYSYTRAGNEFYRAGEPDLAIQKYSEALAMNPNNAMAHQRLGFLLFNVRNKTDEGLVHAQEAVRLESMNPFAQYDLGMAMMEMGDGTNAAIHLAEAVRLLPNGFDSQYNAVDMRFSLAKVLYNLGNAQECRRMVQELLQRVPAHAEGNYLMAMTLIQQRQGEESMPYYQKAIEASPGLAKLPDYYDLLSRDYFDKKDYAAALSAAEKAYGLVCNTRRSDQSARLQRRITQCRQAMSVAAR